MLGQFKYYWVTFDVLKELEKGKWRGLGSSNEIACIR